MRLGTILELLLILLLVAFAAYGRVIERDEVNARSIRSVKQSNLGVSTLSLKQAADNVNRYCTCNENICNCCRDFHIPLVQLKGPGCASLQYLQGDNLAVQLSFGDNILTSTIVNGKSPKPVCVPLPGGFTKFCGRIYSIERDSKNHFKACLGLELQSSTELEASLRVSCFRFGPEGLKLRPAEPLPVVETEVQEEDDDDDFFGLGSDDDDDDDDEDEEDEDSASLANSVPNSSAAEDAEDDDDDDDDEDVLGLGALLDIITGDDESSTKKPKVTTAAPLLQFTIPILNKPSTQSSVEAEEVLVAENNVPTGSEAEGEEHDEQALEPEKIEEESNTDDEDHTENSDVFDSTEDLEDEVTEASNKINVYAKPEKVTTNKVKLTETKKKPTLTSTSINAIDNEIKKKKPLKKPIKDETDDDDDLLGEDDFDDDDDDDDVLDDDDENEKEEEDDDDEDDIDEDDDDDEKEEDEKYDDHKDNEDEKAEDIDDLDDDDDEEEDAMISALVYDEKEEGKKDKVKKNKATNVDDEESDYGLGLSGLLARKRHQRTGRQSRIMRL